MEADGYGYKPDEKGPARLLEDLRTFSPIGIERTAAGWDAHAAPRIDRFREAERTALRALEEARMAPAWDDLRRAILDLTEGRASLVAWRAEHGDTGHRAENATLGAAIGVLARDKIDRKDYETLVRPLAEALPWLLLD
jgi:hypothetical protein